LENLEEMDKLLDTYDLPNLDQKNINYLKTSIMGHEFESVIASEQRRAWD
jgi:hypothetical protein